MHSDCAFQIGKTHRVCQDYAVAGAANKSTFVLLADGCSSSQDTDIGARLLVQSAKRFLPGPSAEDAIWMAYHDAAIAQAAACAESLGLLPTCLDATLLTITATGGAFTACCHGDGVIALGRRDGGLEVYSVSYGASYPYYPSYRLDSARQQQWEKQAGNEKRIQHWAIGPDGLMAEEDTQASRNDFERWSGKAAEYRFVALLSDGAESFSETQETDTSRTPRPVPLPPLLTELLAFKGSRGEFVQRRVTAFSKHCAARRWQHHDDFSLGAVWLEE